MNYLLELKKIIEKHTASVPPKGFEIKYLEKAEKLLELYSDALILEEHMDAEYGKNIKEIYNKALDVVK